MAKLPSAPVTTTTAIRVYAGGPTLPNPNHNLVRVGQVMVNPGDNAVVPDGGAFEVWYDRSAHKLIMDIT